MRHVIMMKIKDVTMKTAYTRMQNIQHQSDFKLILDVASKLYLIQSYKVMTIR